MKNAELKGLWNRYRNRDVHAWTLLYNALRQEAIQYMTQSLSISRDEAEDCVQAFFFRLLNDIGEREELLHIKSSVRGYIFKAIRQNYLKDKERNRGGQGLEEVSAQKLHSPEDGRISTIKQEARDMEDALEKLGQESPQCVRILRMAVMGRVPMKEIALVLDYKNPETVKSKKYTCLQKLKAIYRAA